MVKFFQDRKRLCTFLYILGFITSGVFTLLLLKSNCVDNLSKWLAGSMTVILEFGKGITFIESKKKDRYTEGTRQVLFGMWIFLTLVSIFASQAFLVNETNKISHDTITNSTEFRQLQDKETRLKEQIAIKKDLLNKAIQDKSVNASNVESQRQDNLKLIQSYNQTIKEYQNKIQVKNEELQQAINKKYVNTPERLRAEIRQLTDGLNKTIAARDKLTINDKSTGDQEHIDQLNKDIDSLNNQLNSINFGQIKADLPSNGYIALFGILGALTGLKTSTVTFLFSLLLTVGFEILICMLYHIAVTYTETTTLHPQNKSIGFNPKPLTTPSLQSSDNDRTTLSDDKSRESFAPQTKSNSIGFKMEKVEPASRSCEVDQKSLGKYLDYIYSNIKPDGSIPGYIRTAKELKHDDGSNFDIESVRKLKAHCEHLKIIESDSDSRKTVIIKPRNEINFNF